MVNHHNEFTHHSAEEIDWNAVGQEIEALARIQRNE